MITAATVTGVVKTLLVPRPSHSWLAHMATAGTSALFHGYARLHKHYRKRDAILAALGPTSILVELLVFLLSFLLGMTLLFYAVGSLGFEQSLYESGSTLFTLGVAGALTPLQVALGFCSALIGLVIVALLIGYVLTLNSAYAARESRMAELSLMAGEPAWGPELLCRAALSGDDLSDRAALADWIEWISNIRLTQSTNTVLNFYRSPGPFRSWVIGVLALVDAAALQLTVLRSPRQDLALGPLMRLIAEGTETLMLLWTGQQVSARGRNKDELDASEVSTLRGMRDSASAAAIAKDARRQFRASGAAQRDADISTHGPGIERADFDHACRIMSAAGLPLVADLEAAWGRFAKLRGSYCGYAYALARSHDVVRAPWSGTRNPEDPVIWPALAAEEL